MNYFQVLETTCATDVSSCCSDYGIAMYLYIMKNALTIIQIVVPIILIVMSTIQLIKMMISPDDKKSSKKLLNKFIAAVIVFFIPFIINLILTLPGLDGFELVGCWESAEGIANTLNSSTKYEVIKEEDANFKKVINIEKYKIKKDPKAGKIGTIDNSSTAGKKIVDYALQYVGNPYVYGGSSLISGCDCSHFVYLVLKDVGAYNGSYTTSNNWANLGEEVPGGLSNAQAGDVIVYNGHVGIYDGSNYLIEAKSSSTGITHNRRPQDRQNLIAVRRFV